MWTPCSVSSNRVRGVTVPVGHELVDDYLHVGSATPWRPGPPKACRPRCPPSASRRGRPLARRRPVPVLGTVALRWTIHATRPSPSPTRRGSSAWSLTPCTGWSRTASSAPCGRTT